MADFLNIDTSNFDAEVLRSPMPVLIEFGAVWCAPCKRLEPILLQLAGEWQGRAKFAKIDVDTASDLTMKYMVQGVPTVILFSSGQAVQRTTGLQSRDKLIEKFEPYLK